MPPVTPPDGRNPAHRIKAALTALAAVQAPQGPSQPPMSNGEEPKS